MRRRITLIVVSIAATLAGALPVLASVREMS